MVIEMVKSGMIIGGRYEVLEKIGTGGMSDVYRAKDQKLNRFVAVKILKHEFSENRNFVSKFRVEAQAAAGLMHPNIVNVYDVGEEDNIHYIVMELVEGITLKKYIEKKSRLTTKEAISIAIQVSMGIEAAHNNHIIHRDIKPQNIMISKEGKVKVTDFGIAKAASSNTITSNVMGSVHYTSPEQARGGFSDEKSDIYSLGITMFEMFAGRVPFNGDTTVSIAIKHIQDEMPSLREYVPDVPVSVENIVRKCTQKSPDRRYQCMSDIIKDLKHSLINPDDDIAQLDMPDEIGKTKIVTAGADAGNDPQRQPGREEYATEADLELIASKSNASQRRIMLPLGENTFGQQEYEDDYDYAERKQARAIQQKKQASNIASSNKQTSNKNKNKAGKGGTSKKSANNSSQAGKGGNAGKNGLSGLKNSREQQDDYYGGDGYAEDAGYARAAVTRQNLRKNDYNDERAYMNSRDEYDYNPKAEGFATVLTILGAVIIGLILLYFVGQATGILEQINSMSGRNQDGAKDSVSVLMPEFEGHDVEDVKSAINKVGLGCKTKYAETTQYEKNIVISAALEDGSQVLANDKLSVNTTVVLTVSAGTDGIPVPGVEGMNEAEGTAALTNAGFKVLKTEEASADYAKGIIISQSVEANSTAPIDTEIAIVISSGASDKEVPVPKLTGLSEDAAVSVLEAAELAVGDIDESYSSEFPKGQICYQSYEEGAVVKPGTSVDLKVSIGKEDVKYSCNLTIQAPKDYMGGDAEVILMTAEGEKQLWYSNNVTSFPVAINLNGFDSPSAYGKVIITYPKQVQQVVTDAAGNKTTQLGIDVGQEVKSVQFTQE